MCARTLLLTQRVKLRFFVGSLDPDIRDDELQDSTLRSPNIAPTDPIAILRLDAQGPKLSSVRWGLVPDGKRQAPKSALGRPLINAREDKLLRWGPWRSPFTARRCLVLVSGWMEWRVERQGGCQAAAGVGESLVGNLLPDKDVGDTLEQQAQTSLFGAAPRSSKPQRIPYRFQPRGGGLLALAGMWSPWDPPGAPHTDSAVIITQAAKGDLAGYHDRSPVVLPQSLWGEWLNPETPEPLSLIQPPQPGTLEALRLTERIGRVGDKSEGVQETLGEAVLL